MDDSNKPLVISFLDVPSHWIQGQTRLSEEPCSYYSKISLGTLFGVSRLGTDLSPQSPPCPLPGAQSLGIKLSYALT